MMIETLVSAHRARPFVPFVFRLADGRTLPVPHPEFLAHNGKSRMAIIADDNDGAAWVDLLLVVSIDFAGELANSER